MTNHALTRRAALGAIASILATAGATAPSAAIPVNDPLIDAIAAFRAGLDDYDRNARLEDEEKLDAYAEASFGLPMTVIEEWERPATSKQGAIEALRLALDEMSSFEASPTVPPMVGAALAYLEGLQS
ncbi:hypothetical protein D3227_20535 [Mesorhizobium waimense]|uniref:Twin-arginine translocation pathway signal n=2 Tax=Mesorhizobium waimense TaxID=1300307 RepID=A0A3A5KSC6_9HYPH|nr:hypothetical protein D3227_20535 [Mesorhizobium waimense]